MTAADSEPSCSMHYSTVKGKTDQLENTAGSEDSQAWMVMCEREKTIWGGAQHSARMPSLGGKAVVTTLKSAF